MIARIWHGVVPEEKANDYSEFLLRTWIMDLKKDKGSKGVYVLRRQDSGKTHFRVISLWDSYESIKRFAGEDYQLAKYNSEDEKYLLELEKYVTHYDVLFSPEQDVSQGFVH